MTRTRSAWILLDLPAHGDVDPLNGSLAWESNARHLAVHIDAYSDGLARVGRRTTRHRVWEGQREESPM